MPGPEPEDDLRAEIARLFAENAALRRSRDLLHGIAQHAPAVIYIKDRAGRFVFSNLLHARLLGVSTAEVIGKREGDLLPAEAAAEIDRVREAMFETGTPQSSVFEIELQGEQRVFQELMFPIRDREGEIIALCAMASDITETRRAEERNTALQAEVIASQRRLIRDLSAPILPIADGVVVLALVGSMPQDRSAQIAQILLARIHADGIHTVLFDCTGLTDFDDGAFQQLGMTLQAMRLLGCRALLSGIGVKLARRFLEVGDTSAIETVSTVQAGVALALAEARKKG